MSSKRTRVKDKLAPKQIKVFERALAAHRTGDLAAAESGYLMVLAKAPAHADSVHNLSLLYTQNGHPMLATELLRSACTSAPKNANFALALADLLFAANEYAQAETYYLSASTSSRLAGLARLKAAVCAGYLGREEESVELLSALAERHRDDPDMLADVGTAARAIGAVALALACFESARSARPDDELVLNNLGVCYIDRGEMDAAESVLAHALELNPSNANAWFNRVRLRRYDTADIDVLARMRAALSPNAQDTNASSLLNFALAKVHQDMGAYDEAFEHYRSANSLQARMARYDRAEHEAGLAEVIAAFSPALFSKGAVLDTNLPVFIVGMPRSGTTLVEQILSSHPLVHGAGELRDLAGAARYLSQYGRYPNAMAEFEPRVLTEVAQRYVGKLRALGGETVSRVTDKMPNNFVDLGLAAVLFSGARVIHCRRDPVDTCFSNYIQYFPEGHAYANDIGDVAHFYGIYRRLMDHWEQLLPCSILHVDYESVVDDLEAQARRLVAYVGLDWDPRCVDFHHNKRSVETASNWQVRQPIYQYARQRQRHYHVHLQPLRDALAQAVPGIVLEA
jgi:tetratricopeptide (TPR) repeat protein